MPRIRNNLGFSLTEMLIAVGIMAIGLVMVATVFPVGVKLTTLATERSVGAVASDEAFAKIRLYGLRKSLYWPAANTSPIPDPNATCFACSNFQFISNFDLNASGTVDTADNLTPDWTEFRYPSVASGSAEQQPYHWSALCRRTFGSDSEVQVTVFVTRKTSAGSFYGQDASYNIVSNLAWPSPVKVAVKYQYSSTNPQSKRQLTIMDGPGNLQAITSRFFFSGGYKIVDDYSGVKYKILETKDTNNDNKPDMLVLMSDWQWQGYDSDRLNPPASAQLGYVWVVPPAIGSDRYPCVDIDQEFVQFDNLQ